MPNVRNQSIVEDMTTKLKSIKSAVLVDFRGISVSKQQEIRTELRDNGVQLTVLKNTLLKISAKNAGMEFLPEEVLSGQTAVAFSDEDTVISPKIVFKIQKEIEDFQIKGGFLPDSYLSKDQVERLAKIPGKKELQTQFVSVLAAPLRNLVTVLSGNSRSLVNVLSAYKDKLAS